MAAGYAAGTTFGYTSLSGGDVFTAANLKIMCEMESIVVNNRQYQDYCRLLPPDYQQCAPQTMSILTVFGVDPQSCDITEEAVRATADAIYTAMRSKDEEQRKLYTFFVDTGFPKEISLSTQGAFLIWDFRGQATTTCRATCA